jgi:two-component system, OmpR family, phosphate regulon sensor histidine kinase PhoR
VRVLAKKEGNKQVLEVEDTGIGIPQEHVPFIFERFYRVDKGRSKEMGGTGLGLSIVKHIVFLHGGETRVHSKPREGSRFSVIIPILLK